MFIIASIIGVCGGLLASSPFFKKFSNIKSKIEFLENYRSWLGLVIFGWGIWETYGFIRNLTFLSSYPLVAIFWLLISISDLLVGFLLASNLIAKYYSRNNTSVQNKTELIRNKLDILQIPAGFVSIVLNIIYCIIMIVI